MIPQLMRMLNQTVVIERLVAEDYEGTPTYGPPETYPARIEVTPSRVLGINGSEIPTYATVYTDAEVGDRDRITLPDGTIRVAISVSRLPDLRGNFSHSEVKV